MKNVSIEDEIEFINESNAIEREYSQQASDDAFIAWQYATSKFKRDSGQVTIKLILGIHKRLMENLNPLIAGKFRNLQVGVMTKDGFHEAIYWKEIKTEIEMLCNKGLWPYYLGEDYIKKWHIQFEHIHPFQDGNGRVGRILMNLQRLWIGLPLLIIHEGDEQQEYYKWFKENKDAH